MADEPIALQVAHRVERLVDRRVVRAVCVTEPHVHHVERHEAEVPQVVVHRGDQLVARTGDVPRCVRAARKADLRHEHEVLGIGMQGTTDQFVRDPGTIEIRRVDVVDAERDRLAQQGERGIDVLRRSPHLRPRELHRAVTEPVDGEGRAGKGERPGEGSMRIHAQPS